MTLYLRKLKFSESYPFKCQGKRYYYDIQMENKLYLSQLNCDINKEIRRTLREERKTNYHNLIYQQFIQSLELKQ